MNTIFFKAVIISSVLWGLLFHFLPGSISAEADEGEGGVVNHDQANPKTETLPPMPATGKPKDTPGGQTPPVQEIVSQDQKKQTDPGAAKTKDPSPILDRRWIIKMDKKPIAPVKKKEIVWVDSSQKQHCEVIGSQLRVALQNVKYFTVRGDECSIIKYAENFLTLKDQCNDDCPEPFFKSRGYNPDIVRNVNTLLGLGRKRCLGENSGQSSVKKDNKPK